MREELLNGRHGFWQSSKSYRRIQVGTYYCLHLFLLISFLCLPLVKANHMSEGKRSLNDKVFRELLKAKNRSEIRGIWIRRIKICVCPLFRQKKKSSQQTRRNRKISSDSAFCREILFQSSSVDFIQQEKAGDIFVLKSKMIFPQPFYQHSMFLKLIQPLDVLGIFTRQTSMEQE